MKQVICKDTGAWRTWLEKHHISHDEVWLVFFKGQKAKSHVRYDEALDEALCFGWIDNLVKRIDEEMYALRFVKRNEKSKWSPGNKARVERLKRQKRMTPAGMALVEAAKANGSWSTPDRPLVSHRIPAELKKALEKNRIAKGYFGKLPPSHKTRYIMWISMAKKQETIEKRVREAIRLLEKKKHLGLR